MKKILLPVLLLLACTLFGCKDDKNTASQPIYTHYLFTYFEGKGTPEMQEHLRFAISRDAINWRALNHNAPVVLSDTIAESKGIRDPHILRAENGDFLIVTTDMRASIDGWGTNPGIVLLRSKNLVEWSHSKINLSRDFPEDFSDAHWVWAPQTIYDNEVEKYLIYFTLKRKSDESLITYYAYANKDFTAFESKPKVLFSAKYGSIDNDIVRDNTGLYHLFYKGNLKDSTGMEFQNGIQQATSKNLLGPYVEDYIFLDAYTGTSVHVEGSSTFKLINSDAYVLMYDIYGAGRYEYQMSNDNMRTFDKNPKSFTKDFFPRHGSIIPITTEEARRLAEFFPSDNIDSIFITTDTISNH